jgi:pSer/pThr/pTyr-binding forkhead associated (FHA) protein
VLGATKIGRSSENHVSIPDKPVSRKHAEILYTGGKFYIRDLKSSYGTKVDGKEVTPAGVALHDGAHIQLGTKTVLEFKMLTLKKEVEEDDDKTMIYDQG